MEDSAPPGEGDSAGGAGGVTKLEDIDGVGSSRADALRMAGYESVDAVRGASREDLAAVEGIGIALSDRIKDAVGSRADGDDDTGEADTDEAPGEDEGTGQEITDDDLARGPDPGREGDQEVEPAGSHVEPAAEGGGGLLGYGKAGGPDADEEMPLTEHIEEMLKRLVIVAVVAGVVSVMTFPFAENLINFLWDSILPADTEGDLARPHLYGILELWFTKVKVASLFGVIIGLPVLVYQAYRFMRPGLYPNERRYYLAAVPTSLVLALVGVAFAYFIVLPSIFTYFLYYSRDVTTIGFALGRTFNLILIMMGYLAVVFQIPLFLMLAMMMGLVTRQWLADRRLLFWGAFLGISFLFSPDPTGMVPILVTLTMIALFEGTLLLTRWTGGGPGERGIGA